MMIYDEKYDDYFKLKVFLVIIIDLLFMFAIFRNGLISRFDFNENKNNKIITNVLIGFAAIILSFVFYFSLAEFIKILLIKSDLISG
jgi:hypothetical protein